jgi:putative flavoprotein involved in K+ transport
MYAINTIIVGGGQAGLAMSYWLRRHHIEHVVFERGRIGERWRSERWDSLRLLTPNWQSRLPGLTYRGTEPSGFMSKDTLVRYLESYADEIDAPVHQNTSVLSMREDMQGYLVTTNSGTWRCQNIVIATGACDLPNVPLSASKLSSKVAQVLPTRYRRPSDLPKGGVLVVGASATGIQLADEIHASGRPVTLSVSKHTRLPRAYRGRDIMDWLETLGILDQRIEDVADPERSRAQPSLQLVGRSDLEALDLRTLQQQGIQLVGRVQDIEGVQITLEDNLKEDIARSEARLTRLLDEIDSYIDTFGLYEAVGSSRRPLEVKVEQTPTSLNLEERGITSVVWATGFKRSYPWLHLPIVGPDGEIIHDRGITPARGVYVLGLHFLRRRKSTYLDGVGEDAKELAAHLVLTQKQREETDKCMTC